MHLSTRLIGFIFSGILAAGCAAAANDDVDANTNAISGAAGPAHDARVAEEEAAAKAAHAKEEAAAKAAHAKDLEELRQVLHAAYLAEDAALLREVTPGAAAGEASDKCYQSIAEDVLSRSAKGYRMFDWDLLRSESERATRTDLAGFEPIAALTNKLLNLGLFPKLTYIETPNGSNMDLLFLTSATGTACGTNEAKLVVKCTVPSGDKTTPTLEQCSTVL